MYKNDLNRYFIIPAAFFIFVFMAIFAWNGYAGEPLSVNLDKAIEMALEESEDIQIKENEIDRSRYEYEEEKSALFPQVTAEHALSYNAQYPAFAAATTKDYDMNTSIIATQTLWTFGRVFFNIRAADKKISQSRLNKEVTRQDVIYNTKLSYYNVLFAERVLSIARDSYENAVQNKKILEKRSAGGRSSKRDNIKMEADIASRVPRVSEARAAFDTAMRTFKIIIGVDENERLQLMKDFEENYSELCRDELDKYLYANEPTLKALRKKIEVDADMVRAKRAGFLPTFSAFSTWNYTASNDKYDVWHEEIHNYGVVGIKVTVPLFTGGEKTAILRQAQVDVKNDKLELQKTEKDLVLELDNAISAYHEYIKTLQANREAVELAEKSFRMMQDLFESGQVSLADLNDAELLVTNEKMSFYATLYNLNVTMAKIERLTLMDGGK